MNYLIFRYFEKFRIFWPNFEKFNYQNIEHKIPRNIAGKVGLVSSKKSELEKNKLKCMKFIKNNCSKAQCVHSRLPDHD